ncbi:Kv channel-interacting protein 4-like isoform X2 [Brevipalpus obovatus]|uniref:Kv channel-interacting protein 4-like isoform X2 n=1 Tax=Brevipalpus obovatus TaxID=246614 RepID=UPI003D9F0AB3
MQGVRCNMPSRPAGKRKPLHRLISNQLVSSNQRDLEEFEAQQVHIKPEAIEVLCRLTKFNRKELQIMYRGFKQDCPSGLVKEDTFKIIYAQFFPRTSDTNQYAHLIFRSFDPQRTGAITFTDFVIGLSKLIRGSLQDKLRWTFDMYDINQDGVITRDDLTQIVSAVYELMGKSMDTIIDDQNQVDKVFGKLDLKMKGAVTFDDFLESCLEDENLVRSLSVMDTIF